MSRIERALASDALFRKSVEQEARIAVLAAAVDDQMDAMRKEKFKNLKLRETLSLIRSIAARAAAVGDPDAKAIHAIADAAIAGADR